MAHSKLSCSETEVLLFKDDSDRMKDWVLQYPNSETGGQFFGLWTNKFDPYINIVIGPGKGCRHETHSFYQDTGYLKDVGTYLNREFMMCHIGEWHSHHRLRIREPSSGDLNTVWNHFPSGVHHFLLLIATIEEANDVKLWPYLFTASSHTHTRVKLTIIEKDNVFMKEPAVKQSIANGVEVIPVKLAQKPSEKADLKKGSHETWFLTNWGANFVQYLNSMLEKIDPKKSKTIEKHFDKEKSTLQFSFIFRGYGVAIIFPPDFPHAAITFRMNTKDNKWKWKMKNDAEHDESLQELGCRIVEYLRNIHSINK